MDCHHLIYKPLATPNSYERFIEIQRKKEATQKKQLFYKEILKFKSSRYPPQFIEQLESQISPFEYSLDSLKQIILKKHSQYPEDVVNESVEYVFNKKSREATMMRESMLVIEDGDEYIRNGRRLMKEDFTYGFDKSFEEKQMDSSPRRRNQSNMSEISFRSKSGSITKRENLNTSFKTPDSNLKNIKRDTELELREPLTQQIYGKNEIFNQMIAEQLRKERLRHKNLELIYENDIDDILIKEELMKKNAGFTDRSMKSGLNVSFPFFKEKDVVVPADGGFETGRTEMEELNFLLSEISILGQERREGNTTRRSRGTPYNVRINRQNMDNLYNAQGNLKIDVIKRAVQRMKRNESLDIYSKQK